MEDTLKIEVNIREDVATVALQGRLNTVTSPDFRAKVDALPKDVRSVDVDFGGLEHISSAGLRVLAAADELMSERGGRVRILNVNAAVREVLDMTGFSEIFELA